MVATESALNGRRDLSRRARLRTLLRRRRRFWRNVVFFVVVLGGMVVATIVNRDFQQLRGVRKQAKLIAVALEDSYLSQNSLPLRFPELPPPYVNLHEQYSFNIYYAGQSRWTRPVGVCCLKAPARFYMRPAGRALVLYDGKQFNATWMSEHEFRDVAETLGFGALLD